MRFTQRPRVEIIGDMLDASRHGRTKTGIMRVSKLNFPLACQYIQSLHDAELLKRMPPGGGSNDGETYQTTDKGLRYLKIYQRLKGTVRRIPRQ